MAAFAQSSQTMNGANRSLNSQGATADLHKAQTADEREANNEDVYDILNIR